MTVSYIDAVQQFEDTIAWAHISRFLDYIIAVHEPHIIAPERLVECLFQVTGVTA